MSSYIDFGRKAFIAGAAISQNLRVKLVGGQLALAGVADRDIGTLRDSAFAAGDSRAVSLRTKQGTSQYVAAAAIASGADVFSAANGQISATQAAGAYFIGTALQAATAANDVIEVLLGGYSPQSNQLVPAGFTLTPAAGSANVSLVTIQAVNAAGAAVSGVFNLDVWLSDAATGAGLTATTASGAVAAGASGTDLGDYTAKKAKRVQTAANGRYILSITDAAKTGFYVGAQVGANVSISGQLIIANYG